ncbi:MAG: helix-turn-helix transcriptional regulator [Myxococcota bacterium]
MMVAEIQNVLGALAAKATSAAFAELLAVDNDVKIGRVAGSGLDGDVPRTGTGSVWMVIPELWTCRRQLPLNGLARLGDDLVGFVTRDKRIAGMVLVRNASRRPGAMALDTLREAIQDLRPPNETGESWIADRRGRPLLWQADRPAPAIIPNVHEGPLLFCGGAYHTTQALTGGETPRFMVARMPARWLNITPLLRLSPHQIEVAESAAAGATIPEIARSLNRSDETIKSHLREVYRRLDVGSRLELAEICNAAW